MSVKLGLVVHTSNICVVKFAHDVTGAMLPVKSVHKGLRKSIILNKKVKKFIGNLL